MSCLPSPVRQAAEVPTTAQVPLEAPSLLSAGLSATTGLDGRIHDPGCATSGPPLASACPPSTLVHSYEVELFGCSQAYSPNSPAINNCGDRLVGSFGGSQYPSDAAARAALSLPMGPFPAPKPPPNNQAAYLGHGITGQLHLDKSDPTQDSLTWTEGSWSFTVNDQDGRGPPTLTSAARPLVAYLNTHLLPETTGVMSISLASSRHYGPGNATGAAWVWGHDVYDVLEAGAVGAAELAVNMRAVGLPESSSPVEAPGNKAAGRADAIHACESNVLGDDQDAAAGTFEVTQAAWVAQRAAGLDPQWQPLASALSYVGSLPETSNTNLDIDQAYLDESVVSLVCASLAPSFGSADVGTASTDALHACQASAYAFSEPGAGYTAASLDKAFSDAQLAARLDPKWAQLADGVDLLASLPPPAGYPAIGPAVLNQSLKMIRSACNFPGYHLPPASGRISVTNP